MTSEFESFEELQSEIIKLNPNEVVLEKSLFNNIEIKETLEKKYSLNIYFFSDKSDSYKNLVNHF
jgi:DNA mismatch repair ATPase MutS